VYVSLGASSALIPAGSLAAFTAAVFMKAVSHGDGGSSCLVAGVLACAA